MNYAALDAGNAVVLFADLQDGIIERAATIELARLRRAVSALAKLAKLFEAIASTRRKVLLIAGVATEVIVQHSALSGADRGMQVQVVLDACGGISTRTEDAAFRGLTQAGVITTSVASVAGQLAGDFSQPRGGQAIGILYEMAAG